MTPSPLTPSPLTAALGRAIACDRASARKADVNGWFEVADNPISKVGVFDYHGSTLPDAPDRNRVYRVYRPAQELGAPSFLDSMRLIPWINDHEMLGEQIGGTPTDEYGVHGVVGQDSRFDGQYVRSNIKVYSSKMAADLRAGKKELSLGYQCRIEWTPGHFDGQRYDCIQRDLRANHLALVTEGRMGPDVAVLDNGQDRLTITADSLEYKEMPDNTEPKTDPTLKDVVAMFESVKPALEALAPLIASMKPAAVAEEDETPAEGPTAPVVQAGADSEETAPLAAMDAALKSMRDTIAAQAKTIKELQDGQASAAKSVAMDASAKISIVDRLKPLVGVFDHSGMTASDAVAYGVEKLGLKPAAGTEAVALDSYLLGIAAAAPRATTITADSKPKAGSFVDKILNPATQE